MIWFFSGLGLGLTVAWVVHYQAGKYWMGTNRAIYYGFATPDENGNLGWDRVPSPGRFPEVG